MTARTLTVAVYAVIGLAGVLLELVASAPRSPVPRFGDVLSQAMSTRPGRLGVLAAWVWLGLHFFGR